MLNVITLSVSSTVSVIVLQEIGLQYVSRERERERERERVREREREREKERQRKRVVNMSEK